MPKNQLHDRQKTIGPQHIKGQKATMPKKPAPSLPEDLWTTTHQRPEGYHAQKTSSTSAGRPLDHNTSKARRLPCPRKPASQLPEDLWTATHQRPEAYHAQKTGSTSTRRPFDRKTSKARRLPCPKKQLHECQKTFGPQHIKVKKATMPKKPAPRLLEDLWTPTHQRPEGYHALKTSSTSARRPFNSNKSKARRLPCPRTCSTSARRPLDRNISKARRLPCLKKRLLVC